jgi:carboxymethylenebutenolidase
MPGYLAAPASTGRVPGVVVLHDAAGMSQDLRNQADWLAAEGFLAVAPDLYHPGKVSCIRTIIRDLIAGRESTWTASALSDIESARAWLSLQPGCSGRAGVIGFCMGGGFALLLASGCGFSASSVNYGGQLPADVDTFLATACPIVASYGAKDRWNQGVAGQLECALERGLVVHDVKEYPDAGHSFMNNHESRWFKVLRFANIGYDEQATLDARRRIAAFFHTHLQP